MCVKKREKLRNIRICRLVGKFFFGSAVFTICRVEKFETLLWLTEDHTVKVIYLKMSSLSYFMCSCLVNWLTEKIYKIISNSHVCHRKVRLSFEWERIVLNSKAYTRICIEQPWNNLLGNHLKIFIWSHGCIDWRWNWAPLVRITHSLDWLFFY